MQRLFALVFVCICALPFSASAHEWKVQHSSYQMDTVLMERVWTRLVKETQIPAGIEPPPIVFEKRFPDDANMAFGYPTEPGEKLPMQIVVGRSATNKKNMNSDTFVWGIGHELTHFVFVLRQSGWKYASYYPDYTHHHCNPEFQRVTKALADEIWDAHHDDTVRTFLYREVNRVCEEDLD